jgi:hypothetical protein
MAASCNFKKAKKEEAGAFLALASCGLLSKLPPICRNSNQTQAYGDKIISHYLLQTHPYGQVLQLSAFLSGI